jgi:putative membrane protein
MQRSVIAIALIAGTALLGSVAVARAQMATTDAGFVEHAAHDSAAEIELGALAREKASDPAVRDYGDRLVRDHRTAGVELQALAARKGWQVPAQPDPQHAATRDRLAGLSGGEFDRRFTEEMVKDHQKAISDFERAAQTANDPDLRDWAQKTLPVLREHQRIAQDLSQRLSAMPAASPATVVVVPAKPPWCGGAYDPARGTNFAGCPR